MTIRRLLTNASVLALVAAAPGARAGEPAVPTYTATYAVEYKGKDVGSSEFKVAFDEAKGVYEFTSRTIAKGLLKLVSPKPVVEHSVFRIDAGRIVPQEFWYEDGSRKGDDNKHLVFDWERRVAVVTGEDGRREVPLEPGALDRGSLQVALMRDLLATGTLGSYVLADDDGLSTYDYVDSGKTTTQTGLGAIETREFRQHRDGSSRTTLLWVAPALKFLPARIEQQKNGETQTAFTLRAVEGLAQP